MADARVLLEVQAGLLPGTPMPEYTKQWAISSEEWAARGDEGPDSFMGNEAGQLEMAVDAYAHSLRHSGLNWVQTTWIYL